MYRQKHIKQKVHQVKVFWNWNLQNKMDCTSENLYDFAGSSVLCAILLTYKKRKKSAKIDKKNTQAKQSKAKAYSFQYVLFDLRMLVECDTWYSFPIGEDYFFHFNKYYFLLKLESKHVVLFSQDQRINFM